MAAAARRPRAASAPKAQLPEPGWVKVQKVQLIRREIREILAPSALELLFKYGELVIEAGPELGRGRRAPGHRFYATVMVTVDLGAARPTSASRPTWRPRTSWRS
ncbi:hypothetical protein OV079_41305 [Nannocystis pusilla]|uniref:Uncharacterized protein n=1 Tax=Nannocystis pusilla TaxID=889268 RepID=A0A9X3EYN3_9BACT|nr:hypothetical protein [Nannocystis pusilla]MCY1011889.1 hypothetical protein [Nannocystis pusilla]